MNLYVVKSNAGWCWSDPACDTCMNYRLRISHLSSPTRCATLNNYFFHSTLCQHSRRIFFQHKAAHQNLHNRAEIIGRSNHVSPNRAGFRARLLSPFARPPPKKNHYQTGKLSTNSVLLLPTGPFSDCNLLDSVCVGRLTYRKVNANIWPRSSYF